MYSFDLRGALRTHGHVLRVEFATIMPAGTHTAAPSMHITNKND